MLAWLGWWATVLFMSIWCSGNSAAALELIIYSVIAGFLSWWIIFLKVTNVPLMDGQENVWTFGASLIMFLFLLLLFHTLDVWAGVKRDAHLMRRKKQDEEAQKAVQPSDYSANNDFASGVKEMTDQPVVPQASPDNQPGAVVMNEDDWTSNGKQ
jgi:fumarate reductase subunit D